MARSSRIEAQRTRQQLLKAALSVFARQGVSGTGLEDIAREAGVTRGAIYFHFRGKDDLLQTLLDQQALPLERELPPEIDLSVGWQLLQQDLEKVLADERLRQLCAILLHKSERVDESGPTAHRLKQLAARFSQEVDKLLTRAVATGELHAKLNVSAASAMVRIYVWGLLFEGLFRSRNAVPIATALDALLQGLRNPTQSLLKGKHDPSLQTETALA